MAKKSTKRRSAKRGKSTRRGMGSVTCSRVSGKTVCRPTLSGGKRKSSRKGKRKGGLSGGYHYRAIKGANGIFADKPVKNMFSHAVEALENAILGGGEGRAMVRASNVVPLKPSPIPKRRVLWR